MAAVREYNRRGVKTVTAYAYPKVRRGEAPRAASKIRIS